jgi:hypothetical protein
MITQGTWVELNGKKYLAMPGGNVRLTFKRKGQPVDRWYYKGEKIADKIFSLACEAAG